jgi:hypothetical protein
LSSGSPRRRWAAPTSVPPASRKSLDASERGGSTVCTASA